jgi:hypothetical protein
VLNALLQAWENLDRASLPSASTALYASPITGGSELASTPPAQARSATGTATTDVSIVATPGTPCRVLSLVDPHLATAYRAVDEGERVLHFRLSHFLDDLPDALLGQAEEARARVMMGSPSSCNAGPSASFWCFKARSTRFKAASAACASIIRSTATAAQAAATLAPA